MDTKRCPGFVNRLSQDGLAQVLCFRPYGLAQENGRLRLARKDRFWPQADIELDQVATSQAGIRDLYGDEVLRILDLSVAFNSKSLFYVINP